MYQLNGFNEELSMAAAAGLFFSTNTEQETLNKRVRPSDEQLERLRARKDELIVHLKRDLPIRCGVPVSTWLQKQPY